MTVLRNFQLRVRNQTASSDLYARARGGLDALRSPRPRWQTCKLAAVDQLWDAERDAYWAYSRGGRQGWRGGGVRCLNPGPVDLPWWWYRGFHYPGLRLILLHGALAYREDALHPAGSFAAQQDNWAPVYGAVWTSDDTLVHECLRGGNPPASVSAIDLGVLRSQATLLPGTHLFLGWLSKNYGHFLLESLSYLWPLLVTEIDSAGLAYVAYAMEDRGLEQCRTGTIPEFLAQAFDRFGIDLARVRLIREPVVFERLIVPTPSLHTARPSYASPVQASVWAAVQGARWPGTGSALYLSRRDYRLASRQRRPLRNEMDVEDLFRRQGFDIVYPETLGFAEQLARYGRCSVMAGPIGSNMHNSAFLPDGAKVLLIAPTSFAPRASFLINAPKKIESYYYFVSAEEVVHDSQEPWEVDLADLQAVLSKHAPEWTSLS